MPPFGVPKTLISNVFYNGSRAVYNYEVIANYSGALNFQLTANSQAPTPTWDVVNLQNSIPVTGTFTTPGSSCKYRIIGNTGDTLYSSLLIGVTTQEEYTDYDDIKNIQLKKVTSDNNSTSSFTATVPNQNGQHINDFSIGNEIKIYIDKDVNPPTTLQFTGTIDDISISDQGQVKNDMTLVGRDYTARLQNVTIEPTIYSNLDSGSIVKSIAAEFVSGITTGSVENTGFIISRIPFNHTPVYDGIMQLAGYSDYMFMVDQYKNLNFKPKSSVLLGITLGSANVPKAKFTDTNRKLYNRVWVYGDRVLSASPTKTQTSNGVGSVINLDFKPYNVQVRDSGTNIVKGAVFNQTSLPSSGTAYMIDYDNQQIIWVSGPTLGNNIPGSLTVSNVDFDRSLPIVKYAEDTDSIQLYGPYNKVITDKSIKDPRTAEELAESILAQNAYPKEQGEITLQGVAPLNAGDNVGIYLPFHNVSGTYNIFEIDYKINPVNNLKDEVMYLKVGEKIPDITDTLKQQILDIRKLQAGDIDPTDVITRLQNITGSAGARVSSWTVSTSLIGSDFYVGSPGHPNGWVGSPGSFWVGSHAIQWTIQASGGE